MIFGLQGATLFCVLLNFSEVLRTFAWDCPMLYPPVCIYTSKRIHKKQFLLCFQKPPAMDKILSHLFSNINFSTKSRKMDLSLLNQLFLVSLFCSTLTLGHEPQKYPPGVPPHKGEFIFHFCRHQA